MRALISDPGGIGSSDQLNNVKSSSDGSTMISQDQWINLPVGYNLYDHVGVSFFLAMEYLGHSGLS